MPDELGLAGTSWEGIGPTVVELGIMLSLCAPNHRKTILLCALRCAIASCFQFSYSRLDSLTPIHVNMWDVNLIWGLTGQSVPESMLTPPNVFKDIEINATHASLCVS